jgi:signal transduction histidine kinase
VIFYCVVSAFTNAAFSLVCGVAVLWKDWRNPRNMAFALMTLATVVWSGGYFFWQISADADNALLFCRILTAGSAAILVAYYHFVRLLLGLGTDRWTVVGYLSTVVFSILSPTDLLVRSVTPKMMFPHWPEPGVLYPLYLVVFMAYGFAAWRLVVDAYRRAPTPRERNQLRWVWMGTGIGTLGGCTNFFLWYDIPIPPIGNALVGFYIAGVGYSIIRLRLLEVDYALIKLGSYCAAVLPLAGLIVGIERLIRLFGLNDTQREALWMISCGAIVIGLFGLIPVLRHRIDALLATTLLRDRFERRDELGALAGRITSMRDDETISRETVRVINEVLEAPAAVYLRGDLEETFEQRAAAGFGEGGMPARFAAGDALAAVLVERRQPMRFDELEAHPDIGATAGHRQALFYLRRAGGVQLAMPIFGDVFFFGFVIVGHRSGRRIFSELDVSLLDSIAGHIGLNLRARQLERRANQTEKLISLGTLAAGLAHELRNPLVSIQTLAQLLGEMDGEASIPADFKATVVRDVNRIVGIVENVSAFATNNKVTLSWVSLDEVVRQAHEIVRADLADAGVSYQFEADAASHVVRANQNQLLQVVINLVNNAAQALRGRADACVRVRLRARPLEDGRPAIELAVSDNGPGIDPEILPRLFEPFTTTKATGVRTKKGGMGLGLAIVKRIVDGHNGLIQVASQKGQGTSFTVTLPCEEGAT